MQEQGYNGWKNFETWAVALWLDNDQGSYEYVRELAQGAGGTFPLGEQLKNLVEESAPDLGASMYADLLTAAMSHVDWVEIASNVLSES